MVDCLKNIRQQRINGNRLRKNKMFYDLKIAFKDGTFLECHRIILVSSSRFFHSILEANASNQNLSTIELNDINPHVFEFLLDYMYMGQVSCHSFELEEKLEVLAVANKLAINGIATYLVSYWFQRTPAQHFLGIWDWAESVGDQQLCKQVMNHLLTHYQIIIDGQEFLRIPLNRLLVILQSKGFAKEATHDILLTSILKWVQYKLATRKCHFNELIYYIDVEKISKEMRETFNDDIVWAQGAMLAHQLCGSAKKKKSVECLSLEKSTKSISSLCQTVNEPDEISFDCPVLTASEEEILKEKRTTSADADVSLENHSVKSSYLYKFKEALRNPRKTDTSYPTDRNNFAAAIQCHSGPALLVVGRGDVNQLLVHVYVPAKSAWTNPIEIPTPPLNNRGFLSSDGTIYMIGGENERGQKLESFFTYNMKTCVLEQNVNMRVKRCSAGVALWKGLIVAAGGLSRFGRSMTHVELYNPDIGAWTLMPPLRYPRFEAGATVVGDHLYMIGGNTVKCEYYDIANDVGWQDVVSLPDLYRDSGIQCAAHDSHIFAFRSFRPDKVCCFDPRRREWRMARTSGKPPSDIVGLFNHNGDIYSVESSGKMHVFDVETVRWQQSISVPKACTRPLHLSYLDLDNFK